jgi:hypothetical protein
LQKEKFEMDGFLPPAQADFKEPVRIHTIAEMAEKCLKHLENPAAPGFKDQLLELHRCLNLFAKSSPQEEHALQTLLRERVSRRGIIPPTIGNENLILAEAGMGNCNPKNMDRVRVFIAFLASPYSREEQVRRFA